MNADNHIHTYYSDDSECPMRDMVERAVEIGLDEMTFTEHVDYEVKDVENCDYEKYFAEIAQLRKEYDGRIEIRQGIEFGVQAGTVPRYIEDVKKYPFDFIILSVHQVDNQEFWTGEFQKGRTQDEYQQAYYQAIYDVMRKFGDYSILGHLDMIKRYDPAGDYPDEKIMPVVDKILTQAITDGKGIEVNTSSFKYGLKDLTQSAAILKRYRELGGEILTIGSDSHETEHLADHIPEVKERLKAMGYEHFYTFDRLKPVRHDL